MEIQQIDINDKTWVEKHGDKYLFIYQSQGGDKSAIFVALSMEDLKKLLNSIEVTN